MVFLNFLNFFAILLEFSITRRVGTERTDNFYFFSFSSFSNLFLAWNEAIMVFLKFLNFLLFFGIFYFASGRNEMERYFLYSLFLGIFQPILALNEAIVVFFHFFAIFLEFSITRRVVTKRNDNFYLLSFSAFSNLFWLERKP